MNGNLDPGLTIGRGVAFPPRLGPDGRLAFSAGEPNVREAIQVILLTNERERVQLPAFGGSLNRWLFEPNTVANRHLLGDWITQALTRWEPRIRVQSVTVDPDPVDPQAAVATIVYSLIATRAAERVSLTVSLAG